MYWSMPEPVDATSAMEVTENQMQDSVKSIPVILRKHQFIPHDSIPHQPVPEEQLN